MSKKCFKCGAVQPLTEFYKHGMMADGHLNKCKSCTRLDTRKNRIKNAEYYREYDRKRGNRQGDGYLQAYREKFPEKYRAHNMVSNAIRDGKMTRPDHCQGCGVRCVVHGHHEDYDKPLDVVWLCSSCHSFVHALEGF